MDEGDKGMSEEKKERFEVLLEGIKSKVDLIAEGHSGLNRKIDGLRDELGGRLDKLEVGQQKLETGQEELKRAIITVDKKLDATAQASYGLLLDVRGDVRQVKISLKEEIKKVGDKLDAHLGARV